MTRPLTLPVSDRLARTIRQVADAIATADALLITAGAGMSADSGLQVFRGNEGFWRAYPPLAAQKISFERMAQPMWFEERPRMAWAFYGHRLQLYRDAVPHVGHSLLLRWGERTPYGGFVVTSNVDGQFAKAGFAANAIAEHHGSIHRLQCMQPCTGDTWESPATDLNIDLDTLEARGELPACPSCGRIARPNILMFNDAEWIDTFTRQQMRAFEAWQASVQDRRLVILEIGAGTAIPTIRHIGERAAQRARTMLVRINPDARDGEDSATVVPLPALQALTLIDAAMPRAGGARESKRIPESSGGGGPSGLSMRTLPSREMAVVDLPVAVRAKRARAKPGTVHYSDLRSGYSQVFSTTDLQFAERQLCLAHWHLAQGQFASLPALRGIDPTGYSMRGRVVVSSEQEPRSHRGGGWLQVRDPRGELVATVAFAHLPRAGAYLWRMLHEDAKGPIQPLEYPQEPWITRRLEPAAGRNAAMLAVLSFVEFAIAVAWLEQSE